MALLNKLFNTRRRNSGRSQQRDFLDSSGWHPPTFTKDQIRVLVFRECEVRGRKLLFDWKTVRKTSVEKTPKSKACKSACPRNGACQTTGRSDDPLEVAHNGIVYHYLRPKSDVKMLGEMVFGSVAMSYKGVTIKIHHIRTPPQLMFCKVFPAPVASRDRDSDGCSSLTNSISDYLPKRPSQSYSANSLAHSVPVDVPHLQYEDDLDFLASSSLRSNGSFGSTHSFQQCPPEGGGSSSSQDSLTRSGSYNSLQRRLARSHTTSLEFGVQRQPSDNVGSKEENRTPNSRRTKLGISVVVSMGEQEDEERHFQTFFFSHVTLIEGYLNKLSDSVNKAYINRRQFVPLVMEGVETLQQSLYDLYVAPRFPDPVWLSMMAPGAQQHKLCLRFMTEFMRLLELYDNKNTKYFVSTLLTAVLTHHLAWVATVTPSDILPSHSRGERHTPNWLDQLAKFQPYNPLWVQLCDLYGAVGAPFKVAKTVVVGENSELVRRLIYCLTYFVRCSEVYENMETRVVPPVGRPANPMATSASSVSSVGTLVGESQSPLTPSQSSSSNVAAGSAAIGETVTAEGGQRRRRSIETITEGVERHDCDGGEEDDEEDEVFEGSEDTVLREAQDRRRVEDADQKTRRHGVIYDSCQSTEAAEDSLISESASMDGQTSLDTDRDSGIDSYVDGACEPISSMVIVRDDRLCTGGGITTELKPVAAVRSRRRRGAPGKVVFTIGNIPLKDICGGKEITRPHSNGGEISTTQKPVMEEALVCTCGKHVAAGVLGGVSVRPRQFVTSVEDDFADVDRIAFSDEMTCAVAYKSLGATLDSGIHSCEGSDLDLAAEPAGLGLSRRKSSVSVLDILPPPVRVEHLRSLGKSLPPWPIDAIGPDTNHSVKSICSDAKLNCLSEGVGHTNGVADHPVISETIASSPDRLHPTPTLDQAKKSNSENAEKARTSFERFQCFERSSSMFDEYFEGDVELKMLDDDKLREQIQIRCQKPSVRPTLRRVGKESMLDGQDQMGSDGAVWPTVALSNLENGDYDGEVRSVLWNTTLPSLPTSPTPSTDKEDFFDRVAYLPLPTSEIKQPANSTKDYQRGFGWSLTSNFAEHYMSDFALQGTPDSKFGGRLSEDLRNGVQHPVLDENIVEAVSIVADTNKWTVEVVSDRQGAVSETGAPVGVRVTTSQLVVGMTESLLQLWKLKMSPEFCLMHLEDRLQEFFFKSCLLADYFREALPLDVQHVSSILDLDSSDLPLLLAICLTHSPDVPCTFGISYR